LFWTLGKDEKMTDYFPPSLPLEVDVESKAVLKKLISAHRYLAELKGVVATIPNETILISTLTLQEAKDSSEIENIITTHDEIFKAELFADIVKDAAAKEVGHYAAALRIGFGLVQEAGLVTNNHIIKIQRELEQNTAGFRKLPGTTLMNETTGEVVYTPPQNIEDIQVLMNNLEQYMNVDDVCPLDPLIKMALIHHQFESIHPFYDGNGRTGRILCILYLFSQKLLQIPVLYISRFIIQNKDDYYRLLQETRETGNYEPWILYMLSGIESTSRQTIEIIKNIRVIMADYKLRIRRDFPKIYSQDLLNNLFKHPYTKIEFLQHDIGKSRITATKYLDILTKEGFLKKRKIGKYNFYMNMPLLDVLINLPNLENG
jgi:Fic family protein